MGYTPDVLNDCVANLAFTLLLDVARGASAANRFIRRGDWLHGKPGLGRKVSGARWPIRPGSLNHRCPHWRAGPTF